MTKRYTAADFANAKFAEHPSGSKAVRSGYPLPPWLIDSSGAPFVWQEDQEMADEGWVPVIPARTIHDRDVEALCTDKASYERDDYLDGFIRGFQQAGGTILDDPEPTNTDRLEKLIISAPGNFEGVEAILKRPANVRAWAEYLNDHGVTAPKEDN